MQSLTDDVRRIYAAAVPEAMRYLPEAAIGVAGTATSLAAIDLELDPYDPTAVEGHVLERATCEMLLARMSRLSVAQLRALPGLHPDRASVIVAGTVLLIGATTQNPFFAINAPLLSRSTIFTFEPLSREHIKALLRRALADPERGLGSIPVEADEAALDFLAEVSDGDARRALYHRAVDGWRARLRRPTLVAPAAEDTVHRAGTADQFTDSDQRLLLQDALARLTPKQRAVLVLRFYEDRTETETAAILGWSVSTVKTSTRGALARLRATSPELADLWVGAPGKVAAR